MDKKSNFACISVMSIDILDLIIAAQQISFALPAYCYHALRWRK